MMKCVSCFWWSSPSTFNNFLVLLAICICNSFLVDPVVSWSSSSRSSSSSSSAIIMTKKRNMPLCKTETELKLASTGLASSDTLSLSSIASLSTLPKLIIYDLDNTLWTPELYQIRQKNVPKANKEIRLFDDAHEILKFLHEKNSDLLFANAIASRTSKAHWAHQLLDDFEIHPEVPMRSLFEHIVIRTGSKKRHLADLRESTGVSYNEMLFIDDDVRMNLNECSQLGVCCVHTPRGITREHFVKSLIKYDELKSGHDANHWMGYILNNENLEIEETTTTSQDGRKCEGRVKFYSDQKRFGFVIDGGTGDEFFFHESKVPSGMRVRTGDQVSFEAMMSDARGRPSAVILGRTGSTSGTTSAPSSHGGSSATVSTPCFTMSQPFASLLLNGYKTVESRNGPMFKDVAPGTKVLLHCGRRDWHDLESYKNILAADHGLSDEEILNAGRLPKGFTKGSIIGVVTVGKTWLSSDRERKGNALRTSVLAPFEGIGKFCTEINAAQWLSKPYRTRGNPGVYDVDIPKNYLPEEQ